jgi:purine-nucleoside phosphorylase
MLSQRVKETSEFLKRNWNGAEIGVILGSGWSSIADEIKKKYVIPYKEIPNFPQSTVKGHKGELVLGKLENRPVALLSGRFHYYEGYSLREATFPVRVLGKLGVKILILTNAAGGIRPNFTPGDMMIIKDHLNFIPDNPLRGPHEPELGERFISLTNTYDKTLRKKALACARQLKLRVHEGVYLALPGPSYETPAEVKLFRSFGASAIGMSTVPEAIVAVQCGMSVLALSLITNVHKNGVSPKHAEVLETAEKFQGKFKTLLRCILKKII